MSAEIELLQRRVAFLEQQLRATQINMKYQRYSLLGRSRLEAEGASVPVTEHHQPDNGHYHELIGVMAKLMPYGYRTPDKILKLAHSPYSWKRFLWRHPLKIRLWRTVKQLQRHIKR